MNSLIQGQAQYSQKFFQESKSHARDGETNRVDAFTQPAFEATPSPVGNEDLQISPNTVAQLDSELTFDLPQNALLGEPYLVCSLGALAAGNYANYPGLNLIRQLELKSNSQTIQQFDMDAAMVEVLSRASAEFSDLVADVTGGTGFASGDFVVPLPVFWSQMMDFDQAPVPLNTNLVNSKMQLVVNVRGVNDIKLTASTAPSASFTCVLKFKKFSVDSKLAALHLSERPSWLYKGYDFKTLTNKTVATATSTEYDLSAVKGSVAAWCLLLRSSANLANNQRFDLEDLTRVSWAADGENLQQLDKTGNAKALKWSSWAHGDQRGLDTTFGNPFRWVVAAVEKPTAFMGGQDSRALTSNIVTVQHSVGADCQIKAVARLNAYWHVEDETFVRVI